MRVAAGLAWLCVACVSIAGPARGQAISTQPLPPPAAVPSARPPAAPTAPAKPRAKPPLVAAPTTPAKKPVATKSAPKAALAKPVVPKAAVPKPAVPKLAPVAKPTAPDAPTPPKADPTKGTSTNLPIPRWVSFRSDEVNLRTGPGTQYPIDWVYHRRDYPVQVLREFEVWRLVREQDGTKGWVHAATLTGRRGFAVLAGAAAGPQVLRGSAADTADAVAQLMPGVVGHIRKCPAGSTWCEVQAGEFRGWLPRAAIYGVSADEAVE